MISNIHQPSTANRRRNSQFIYTVQKIHLCFLSYHQRCRNSQFQSFLLPMTD